MSEFKQDFVDFLKVLADRTRLEILDLLHHENKPSSEIQSALNKSQSTISQHLKVLSSKYLVDFERINNVKYYKIRNKEIFNLLVDIKAHVTNINKEKLQAISDEGVVDTLL
jgi:DNA-binding transcriptional ArsR family regulator